MEQLQIKHSVPIRHTVDLCVVGGGPAGLAAAILAARQGLSVFLAESQGFFGGAATAGLVPAFMRFDNGVHFLAGGFGKEVYDRCLAAGFPVSHGTSLGIQPERLKKIYDDMVTAEENIRFSFFTTLTDVVRENGRVQSAIFHAKSGFFAVNAAMFVDASGDGDLCVLAGAPYAQGDENGSTMPATLCSIWADIDFTGQKGADSRELERAFADGVFTQEDRHLPGMWHIAPNLGGGNIGHSFGIDSTNEQSLTQGMLVGRQILPEYERYYREYLGGAYEHAQLVISGSYLGIRESRRIAGDYELTLADFHARQKFADDVGWFSYPVDDHIAAPDKASYDAFHKEHQSLRYKNGESYGIPYRSLLPKTLENVFVAGRCISTDKKMQSSVRVMPACYLMGQAAGLAAALAVRAGHCQTRAVPYAALRAALDEIGTFTTMM